MTEKHEKNLEVNITACPLEPENDPFYDKFSPQQKSIFVFTLSLAVFLTPSTAMALLPAMSTIAREFHTTDNVIIISNACYYVVMAATPCLMTPLGDIYGRRIVALVCSAGFSLFTILVAVSQNIGQFIVFRSFTGVFGSAFFALAGQVIGDIHIPQERGNAMGWTLCGAQLGPAFAPVLGVVSQADEIRRRTGKKFVFVLYNPFKVLISLKHRSLMLCGVMSMSLLYNMCTLTTPIPNVVNPRYKLTSPLYSGLFYLAPGMGSLLGSLYGGKWADRYVVKYMKIRGGRVPEDRLRSMYVSFGIVLPLSVLIYGWSIAKEKGGIPVPVITLFANGVAQMFCFPCINAYTVDCLPHLGGDAIASNYFVRFFAGAIGTATCLVQIQTIGVGWSNTISFFVLLIGFGCCLVLIKYGATFRELEMGDRSSTSQSPETESVREIKVV
ncbi:CIC11C00000002561 [Sungouiella intermedia]|uniref:CIC11C00000002561 n=1 Tax=Sungouiella intermedia TaxID=45354 RepID=A0A1L0DCB0_9ASCO|nr:CIC11C00000002561 [[Candida] intermedia]